jgi:micrococcal nuclease
MRVVDGDTIDVIFDLGFDVHLKSRVRLYGINAPESRTRDLEEKKKGLAAKSRLEDILQDSTFTIKTRLEAGKYGRVLGEIFLEDANVNQQLVKEGHATPYFGGKR